MLHQLTPATEIKKEEPYDEAEYGVRAMQFPEDDVKPSIVPRDVSIEAPNSGDEEEALRQDSSLHPYKSRDVDFITSERGVTMLYFNGYLFYKSHTSAIGTIYRCDRQRTEQCRGRVAVNGTEVQARDVFQYFLELELNAHKCIVWPGRNERKVQEAKASWAARKLRQLRREAAERAGEGGGEYEDEQAIQQQLNDAYANDEILGRPPPLSPQGHSSSSTSNSQGHSSSSTSNSIINTAQCSVDMPAAKVIHHKGHIYYRSYETKLGITYRCERQRTEGCVGRMRMTYDGTYIKDLRYHTCTGEAPTKEKNPPLAARKKRKDAGLTRNPYASIVSSVSREHTNSPSTTAEPSEDCELASWVDEGMPTLPETPIHRNVFPENDSPDEASMPQTSIDEIVYITSERGGSMLYFNDYFFYRSHGTRGGIIYRCDKQRTIDKCPARILVDNRHVTELCQHTCVKQPYKNKSKMMQAKLNAEKEAKRATRLNMKKMFAALSHENRNEDVQMTDWISDVSGQEPIANEKYRVGRKDEEEEEKPPLLQASAHLPAQPFRALERGEQCKWLDEADVKSTTTPVTFPRVLLSAPEVPRPRQYPPQRIPAQPRPTVSDNEPDLKESLDEVRPSTSAFLVPREEVSSISSYNGYNERAELVPSKRGKPMLRYKDGVYYRSHTTRDGEIYRCERQRKELCPARVLFMSEDNVEVLSGHTCRGMSNSRLRESKFHVERRTEPSDAEATDQNTSCYFSTAHDHSYFANPT